MYFVRSQAHYTVRDFAILLQTITVWHSSHNDDTSRPTVNGSL